MSGTYKPFWLNSCTYVREVAAGVDPNTLLPTRTSTNVLVNEKCDLTVKTRTAVIRTDAGTEVTRVKQVILRLDPEDPSTLPREGDIVTVDGEAYRVDTIMEENIDAANGTPMGAAFQLSAPEIIS